MFGFKVGDFVKTVDFNYDELESDTEELIGKEGIIVEVDRGYKYPYTVVFFDKEAQRKSMDWGWMLWREEDLVLID